MVFSGWCLVFGGDMLAHAATSQATVEYVVPRQRSVTQAPYTPLLNGIGLSCVTGGESKRF
jgi:hypothetical protein